MSSHPEDELIHIIFSQADIEEMAEDHQIDLNVAIQHARDWAHYVQNQAIDLIMEQMSRAITGESL